MYDRLFFLSSDETFAVRLVNGLTPAVGRVEVYFDGAWGGVCEWRWGIQDANVVCDQLGYDGAEAPVYHSLFGLQRNFHMIGVNCVGNESRLADCPFAGWKINVHTCHESMGVICKGNSALSPTCLKFAFKRIAENTKKGNIYPMRIDLPRRIRPIQ